MHSWQGLVASLPVALAQRSIGGASGATRTLPLQTHRASAAGSRLPYDNLHEREVRASTAGVRDMLMQPRCARLGFAGLILRPSGFPAPFPGGVLRRGCHFADRKQLRRGMRHVLECGAFVRGARIGARIGALSGVQVCSTRCGGLVRGVVANVVTHLARSSLRRRSASTSQ